jgi:hypothetical protein
VLPDDRGTATGTARSRLGSLKDGDFQTSFGEEERKTRAGNPAADNESIKPTGHKRISFDVSHAPTALSVSRRLRLLHFSAF